MNASLYSDCFQIVSGFVQLAKVTKDRKDNNYFGLGTDPYWNNLAINGVSIQKPILELFYLENFRVLLYLARVYLVLTSCFIVEILLSVMLSRVSLQVFILFMISWSIKAQIREVASLLLRIEKKNLIECIKEMSNLALSRSHQNALSHEFSLSIRRRLHKINITPSQESSQAGYSHQDKTMP